jgi:hypothetical protein
MVDNGCGSVTVNIWCSESVVNLLPVVELNAGVGYADMLSDCDREGTEPILELSGVQSPTGYNTVAPRGEMGDVLEWWDANVPWTMNETVRSLNIQVVLGTESMKRRT